MAKKELDGDSRNKPQSCRPQLDIWVSALSDADKSVNQVKAMLVPTFMKGNQIILRYIWLRRHSLREWCTLGMARHYEL